VGYGLQTIKDPQNGAQLTVEWIKPNIDQDPNEWVLRICAESI